MDPIISTWWSFNFLELNFDDCQSSGFHFSKPKLLIWLLFSIGLGGPPGREANRPVAEVAVKVDFGTVQSSVPLSVKGDETFDVKVGESIGNNYKSIWLSFTPRWVEYM